MTTVNILEIIALLIIIIGGGIVIFKMIKSNNLGNKHRKLNQKIRHFIDDFLYNDYEYKERQKEFIKKRVKKELKKLSNDNKNDKNV